MNVLRTNQIKPVVTSLILGTVLSMATVSTSWAEKDELPEVDKNGLHLVKHSEARVVYVLPGATLSAYTKVKILPTYVAFKKNYERDFNLSEVGLDGRITDKDMEEMKTRLAAEFNKEFTKVLEKKGYPVVDETGKDVLLLRPAIINLNVAAPDALNRSAFMTTVVQSAGDMTLYMELYDSATSELIARVVDPEEDDNSFAQRANRVTNKVAADKIISRWANMLVKRLDEAKGHEKSK